MRHILPSCRSDQCHGYWSCRIIVLESSLSFLGIGVHPLPMSWGQILGDGRMYLTNGWIISVFSGNYAASGSAIHQYLGESLSEIIDPALRRR